MLIGMEAFYGHLLSADCLHREGLSPFPFLEFLAATGMMVDCQRRAVRRRDQGRTFHLERAGPPRQRTRARHLRRCDVEQHRPAFLLPAQSQSGECRRHLHKADDIETLARKINLEPKRLRDLVDAQNRKVAANRAQDELLAAARAAMPSYAKGKHPSRAFDTPPFYAAPACAAMTSTLGGIADRRSWQGPAQRRRDDPGALCRRLDRRRHRGRPGGRLSRRADQGSGVRAARCGAQRRSALSGRVALGRSYRRPAILARALTSGLCLRYTRRRSEKCRKRLSNY